VQYEVDVTVTDTIVVEADSVSEAQQAAYDRGYAHVTDVRLVEDEPVQATTAPLPGRMTAPRENVSAQTAATREDR
jgi:hypothetical protein